MTNTSHLTILRLVVRNDLAKTVKSETIGDRRNLSIYKYFIIYTPIYNILSFKLPTYITGNKERIIYALEEAHMKTRTPNIDSILNFVMVRRLN